MEGTQTLLILIRRTSVFNIVTLYFDNLKRSIVKLLVTKRLKKRITYKLSSLGYDSCKNRKRKMS